MVLCFVRTNSIKMVLVLHILLICKILCCYFSVKAKGYNNAIGFIQNKNSLTLVFIENKLYEFQTVLIKKLLLKLLSSGNQKLIEKNLYNIIIR